MSSSFTPRRSWRLSVPLTLGQLLRKGDQLNLVLELHGRQWEVVECGQMYPRIRPQGAA